MQPMHARIREIGDSHYCKTIYPDQTTLLWTGYRPTRPTHGAFDCTPSQFVRAMHDVHAGRFDLMVVYMSQRSPLHPRYWFRSLAQTPLKPYSAMARVFGVSWLRAMRLPIPLMVMDMNDQFGIGPSNFFLLDKADAVSSANSQQTAGMSCTARRTIRCRRCAYGVSPAGRSGLRKSGRSRCLRR